MRSYRDVRWTEVHDNITGGSIFFTFDKCEGASEFKYETLHTPTQTAIPRTIYGVNEEIGQRLLDKWNKEGKGLWTYKKIN